MDYEQKYNKLVNAIKVLQETNPSDEGIQNWVNDNVPELSKSEDERIRGELIEFVEFVADSQSNKEEWLAWLEKQGQKSINDTDEDIVEVVKDTSILDMVESKSKTGDQLENQGGIDNCPLEYSTNVVITDLKKNQVKPTFKVGDWVVLYPSEIEVNRKVVQISRIEKCQLNMYWTTEGTWFGDGTDARLWTIQDAKPGDVLVDEDNNIGIYKEIKDIWWNSYIYLGCNNCLYGPGIGGMHVQNSTKPATKNQRDLLFSKMKESGYEWDAERKELK